MDNIGWLAGMFDGEGCLSLMLRKCGLFQLSVSVTNADIEALTLFELRFGGKISQHSGKRPCWRWRITGRDTTKAFLEALLPHLVIKRKQAELVLEYLSTVKDSRVYFGINNRLSPEVIQHRKDLVRKLAKRAITVQNPSTGIKGFGS